MYMGEPVVEVCLADNGFMVKTVDMEGREKARKKAQVKAGKDSPCCPTSVDYEEFEKKVVFEKISDVVRFITKELPDLAGGLKGKEAFDSAFNEKEY